MTNFSAIHSVWKGFFLAILFAIVGTGTTHSQSFTDITSTLFTSIPPAKSGGDIIVADLNQDNFLDLTLVGPGSATEVYSYSTGSFIPVPNAVSLPDVDNSQPGVADIDGDGNLDLLFVGNDGFSRYAQIILNQGGSNFIAGTSFPSSAVGEGANSFADYNNDGQMDFIILGEVVGGAKIAHIYRHDPFPGTGFQLDTTLDGVKNPSVEWGDYDNDGDLDLLYCGEGINNSPTTRLYNNLGNNAFAQSSSTLPNVRFGSVDWGDYDNDGDLDILICGQDGNNNQITRVYKNDGNQTFNLISANLPGIERGEAQWVDYNADGRLDIFLLGQSGANSTDRISELYTNDGNGNFVLEVTLSNAIPELNGGITGFARVQWADIVLESPGNNRTLEAIVTGETSTGPIFRIYQLTGATVNNTRSNAPQGLSATQSGTSVNLTWHAPNNINPFILSGQGYNLAIGTTPTNTVIKPAQADLTTGFSRTTFEGSVRDTSWTLTGLIPGQTYYWRVQAVDQNLEGGVWSTTNSFTYVNPTATSSAFADSTNTDIGGLFELRFAAMEFGDFDQDGDMDMIVCGEQETVATQRTLYYSYDAGSGQFLPNDVGTSPFPQVDEGDVAVGDLDLDGALDIVIGGLEGGTSVLEYFINDKNGNFFDNATFSGSFTEGIANGSIDLGDFDNDGDLDVLVTGGFSPSQATRIYLNQIVETGSLSFTDFTPSAGFDGLVDVFRSDAEFGDFDHDGYPDVLISGFLIDQSAPITRVYKNEGGQGFTLVESFPALKSSAVKWADLDNDGFLDALALGLDDVFPSKNPSFYVKKNFAGLAFTDYTVNGSIDMGEGSIDAGDYNGDGYTDILITGSDAATFTGPPSFQTQLFLNNGNPISNELDLDNLSTAVLSNVSNGDARFVDYTGDNKLDIVLVGQDASNSNTFRLYQNVHPHTPILPPSPLNIEHKIQNFDVNITWDAPVNDPGLSYELLFFKEGLVDSLRRYTAFDTTGTSLRYRYDVSTGNVYQNQTFTIRDLTPGNYSYMVQTINQARNGSSFDSTITFRFNDPIFIDSTSIAGNGLFLSPPNGFKDGAIELGDYRGTDGRLDMVILGETDTEPQETQLYYWDNGRFVLDGLSSSKLTPLHDGDAAWLDVNNDGRQDLLLMGDSAGVPQTKLFINNNGAFDNNNPSVSFRTFPGLRNGALATGDFNNDGFEDFLVTGENNLNQATTLLFQNNAKLASITNLTEIGFTNLGNLGGILPDVKDSDAAWGDYNHDGALDLLISGRNDAGQRFTHVYTNDGMGSLLPNPLTFTGLYDGSVDWGDFDNDGWLDIAYTGTNDSKILGIILKNDANGGFSQFSSPLEGTINGNIQFGDYDLDGFKDILLTGNDGFTEFDRTATLYRYNPTNQQFEEDEVAAAPFLAVNEGSQAVWGDINQDDKLDMLLMGQRSSSPDSGAFRYYENIGDLTPIPLSAPTNLRDTVIGYDLLMSWDAPNVPSNIRDGLSYNVMVGITQNGTERRHPQSLTSNGQRQIVASGMVTGATAFKFYNLPEGDYFWRVQAINQSFKGSSFSSEEQVTFSFPTFVDSSSLISFANGFSQGDLEFGDYDNDGDLDLVISGDQGGSPLTQLWKNNNGSFALEPTSFENLRLSQLAWADYDADGDLDLVLCGEDQAGTPRTFIYENNAGTFTVLSNTGLPDVRHAALTWFDSDLDGDLDLFLTGEDGSTLVGGVYLNEGNGTFTFVETGISRFREGDVSAADYNNDGFMDLVVVGNPNLSGQNNLLFRVYRNDGLNRFSQRPIENTVPGLWKGSVEWGDANQDGTPEILATGQNNTNNPFAIILELNPSTGVFEFTSIPYNTVPLGVTNGEGKWGDFNDDGFQDFLYAGEDFSGALNGHLYLFNSTNNRFDRQTVRSFAFQGVNEASIALGDFNNDEKLDLGLIGENTGGSNQFLRLLGNVDSALNQTPTAVSALQDAQSADTVILSWTAPANQDGFTYNVFVGTQAGADDIVSAMSDLSNGYRTISHIGNAGGDQEFKLTGLADGTYFWGVQAVDLDYEGSAFATGTFDYVNPILTPVNTAVLNANVPTDFHSGDLHAGDADEDGDLDLLVIGRNNNSQVQTLLLENTGERFTLSQNFTGLDQGQIDWVDYDRDGQLEFVQFGLLNGVPTIQSFDNAGSLAFIADEFVSDLPGMSQGTASWTDYNQDGLVDVLLSGQGANGPFSALYTQTATGFVEDQSVSLPGLSTPEAVWADIDQDGDQDFVLVGSDGGTPFTGVYLNNGFRGGFTLYTESALMTLSGSSVAWGDLDNDGFQDLAISGTSGPQPQVFIYRFDNNNQSFTLHSTLLGVQNGSIQWGDLDDDGLTDLTMVGLDGNDQPLAFVYLNNNGTSFTEDVVSSQALLGGTEAQMAWGDFDKDGKLDLATISADSTARRSLSLYQNIDLNPNQSPQAPSPIGFVIDADSVVLSWNDPNDGLTYQYSVYEIGADTFSVVPDADTLSGLRRLTAQGNAGSNQRIRLEDLPEGTYTWKVQAIDADYEGSPFAQGDTFTFNPPHFVQSNQILFDEAVQGVSDAQTEWIDYDKDGDLDLFIAGSQGGSPAIFLYQNQLGLKLSLDLQNQAVFTALENAYFAWGDVDLDGSLDLLLGGGTPGNPQLRLYLNESGTFIESTIAVPALSDGQAAFCDVDGEGSLDVIMIGLNDAQIPTTQIYLNQKDNTFKVLNLGGNIPGTRNGSLQVMDLNLDGKNDLVIGGENSQGQTFLSAFLNNPLNGFFPAIDLLPSNWNSVVQPIIEVGDLNNDRYPDIIATASNPAGTLSWISLENQLGSGGNFALLDLGLDGVEGLTEGQAQVGDYDDDGFTDLAITGQGSSQAVTRIYSRKGTDQQFVEDTRASSELISLGTGSHLAWGDYNQDGKIDLAQVGEEALYIYRNDEPSPNNTPSAPQNLNIEIIGADVRLEWESVSDSYSYNVFLVGENDTTFILSPASDTLSGLREIIAQGNGHFANSLTIENLPTKQEGENYLWGVQSIDKDYEGSSFTKGAFAFTPPAFQDISETAFNGSVPDALTEGELVLVDINTDGNLDILTAGIQNGSRVTKVYLNQSGTFIEDPSNDGLTGVSSAMVAVGDWDGDNDPDVFISGITDGNGNLEATLYRNDQGRLVADANASGNLIAVARGDAAWTDFDRDGDEDLMVIGVSQGIKSSTLYRNDGENGLTPLTDIVVGQEGFIALSDGAIAWGDFDLNLGSFDTLDNRPDLVMAGLDENQNPATVIYQNLGNGQFREFARTSLPQLGLSYVNFTDLNNDRFPDLILTGELPDLSLQTAIYPFDPANQEFDVNDPFTTAMIPGVANGIAITGDYDDDGLSDLLISGEISGAQEVATFKNIHDETPQTFLKDLLSSGDLDSLNIRQPVWGDINNDKKLDIVSLGGTSFGNTEESLIVLGNIDLTPNLDELVPENLSLFVDGAKVILSWSDLGTRFTYNLSLTNRTTGQVIVSPLADLNSGKRFVAAEGNMGHNTSILFDTLTTGTYVVRVQTVDADLEGSLFSDSLVFDYTRPVPRWQVNNIATYYPDNGTAESSIVVLNDSVVSSVLVWHRPIANADSAYQSVLAQRSGNTYSFDISQARGDELGVSYYFQLVGKFGFNTLTDTFHTYRTYTEGITYEITRAGRSALDYNIISFPIELTNPRAESFMPEGLGRYSRYRWRMFQWSNSLAVNGELAGAVVQVTPNEGYWLILKDPGGFQTGAGNAVQANVLEPYELEIKEGWNQIGNPYNFRLYWDRVEAANPGTIDNIDGLVNFSGGFTDAEPFIEARRGAFVRSDSNFTLLLPVGKGPKNRLANPEKNQLIGSLDSKQWWVEMHLQNDDLQFGLAGVGMRTGAKKEADKFDSYLPPSLSEYLELSFSTEGPWGAICEDIVPPSDHYVWDFEVRANLNAKKTQLSWPEIPAGEKKLYLLDVETQTRINMQEVNEYPFEVDDAPRKFRLYYGDSKFIEENLTPDHVALGQVFPNPTAGLVQLSLALPDGQTNYQVRLRLVDMKGQEIHTGEWQTFQAGFQQFKWNVLPEDQVIANGVYLLQAEIIWGHQSQVESKQIIINR